jgi:hypothetical protein
MRYPATLIDTYGTTADFAEAATRHHLAPYRLNGERMTLDRAAVYMWKQRNSVPFAWRPVVSAMMVSTQAEGSAA